MEQGDEGKLFDGVAVTIMPTDEHAAETTDALIAPLEANGATYVPFPDSGLIHDLNDITHIISTHVDFIQYDAALAAGVHVVKPTWVMSSVSKRKMASARQHSPDPSQYFHDVVVTCGDLPEGDQEAIIAGVISLGGQYSSPLSKLVTHIVTNDVHHAKCQKALETGLRAQIVLPHWFDDCFKLGRKIKEAPYSFPDPELFREDVPRVRDSNSGILQGAINSRPNAPPQYALPCSPSHSRKNLNALMYRKIMLGNDLELGEHFHQTLRDMIEHSGALLMNDVDAADIFICDYRDGDEYVRASRAGKTVANLSWLCHVLNRNKYTPPLSKLMHYPVPRKGLPGFEGMRISISNYTGDARPYVENLVRACGAEFTKTMKQDNTHLITAHMQSEKCDAAQEWGVNIVNHLWLEESYAKCGPQVLTNPRYSHFPVRTNLGEVTGQTRIDMTKVEQMFYPKPKVTPKKTIVNVKHTAPTSTAIPDASSNGKTPVSMLDDTVEPSTTKRSRGRPRKSAATPRLPDEEKENESPFASNGRASKNKAMDMLIKQAGDIALFQKEMKRKGGVTHGGRRGSVDHEQSSPMPTVASTQRKKRKSDEATYDATAVGSDLSDGETQPVKARRSKKAKHSDPSGLPPIEYRMMVTGDERWMNSKNRESLDRRSLRQLGVLLTTDPRDVQILVAPQIRRTRKFVSALASAPMVVATSYLDHALKEGELLEDLPLLQDTEHEAHYGFTLTGSLARAKINNHRLFHGWTIYITRAVPGGFETYQEIVAVNGGTALPFAGRNGVRIAKRMHVDEKNPDPEWQHQGGTEELEYSYLVSGDSATERKLWEMFQQMCETKRLKGRVVRHDWLLDAAMRQEIVWDEKFAH